ncbi:MAG: hypothetical protein JRI89_07775 [Deltaproteobacteria bacterium]|nr:hypothetical protein [Deltaproteobacteria bacterium]
MVEEIAKKVIERIENMSRAEDEFEDETLREFAVTIQHLLKRHARTEEVLAQAASLCALEQFQKDMQKLIDYAKLGGLKEREATLLEVLDKFEKELATAVATKIDQYGRSEEVASEITEAILLHLEPTLGRGKWQAREKKAILETVSRVMAGYLVAKVEI